MKNKSTIKSQKGSITMYVLVSMIFFIVVILQIYIYTSNNLQKQEEQIVKIQKEYEKQDINELYEETYNHMSIER